MKLIIITGVSRGLGLAFYHGFAKSSDWVIGIGRSFTEQQLEVGSDPESKLELIDWDLSQPMQQEKLEILLNVASDINHREKLTELVFINNAAIIEPIGQIGCLSEDAVLASASVNFMTPIFITNRLIPFVDNLNLTLKIVNISTGAAVYPVDGWSIYGACKAGVAMFFDVLAKQVEDSKWISIYQVDPGVMNTGMQTIIRETDRNTCPQKDYFISLMQSGQLLPVDVVAARIVAECQL